MSTTEVGLTVPVQTTNETYRVYVKTDVDGKAIAKETKFVTAGKEGKTWKDLDNDPSYTLALEQTVREYKVSTWEAAVSLIPDEDERVLMFNAGLTSKSDRKVKAVLTELTEDEKSIAFEPVEVFDSIDLIQEATQKRNLTPFDKATKQVRAAVKALYPNYTENQIEEQVTNLLATMQASASSE